MINGSYSQRNLLLAICGFLITKGQGAKETDREDHLCNSTISVSTDNSTDYSFPLMTCIVKLLRASLKQYF